MTGPDKFTLLNSTRRIPHAGDWDDPTADRLWLYNLHYFDDLVADAARERVEWHDALIRRWVAENPGPQGVGWEPYPLSRRVVNWIKWSLAGNRLPAVAIGSLATQVRYLERRIECHLLGNHLLANAKALAFAGQFFEGEEADRWLQRGLAILTAQLPEQVLGDGGHCERSPMYHAIVLEDLLDLVNLWRTTGTLPPKTIFEAIPSMLRWLGTMSHPDGEIAFFNDAALGVAAPPKDLSDYARRLGMKEAPEPSEGLTALESSGYARLGCADMVALLDVAPLGPDYLPGHGHADTLTFELSVGGRRVIVNSGTSIYEPGFERLRQRGTPAHNTVTVDGQDSSELWGAFRVGRRARPFGLTVDGGGMRVECAHDGYRRLAGRVIHRRQWRLTGRRLEVEDAVEGIWADAVARFHLHPAVIVAADGDGLALQIDGQELRWRSEGGELGVQPSTFHPEFGLSVDTLCVELRLTSPRARTVIELSGDKAAGSWPAHREQVAPLPGGGR